MASMKGSFSPNVWPAGHPNNVAKKKAARESETKATKAKAETVEPKAEQKKSDSKTD